MHRRGVVDLRNIFVILLLACVICVLYVLRREDAYGSFQDKEFNRDDLSIQYTEENEIDNEAEDTDGSLKDYPNFPAVFYKEDAQKPKRINKTCGKFPALDNLRFNNHYWQTLKTPMGEYQLLGAYWDIRPKNKKAPIVRLLAMITPLNITENLYCQFYFKDKVVLSKKTWHYFLWYEAWGGNTKNNYKPYLINCDLPKTYMNNHPVAVSLVRQPCDTPTNIIGITVNIPEKKKDFAVCVKGLDFHDDISIRLIEWIELLKLLGAEKVFFYELHVHKDIKRILQYYEEVEGAVKMTPVTLPGNYPNEPFLQHMFLHQYHPKKRLYELISYNDCFLKHMYEYKYIVLLDIDEVIVPSTGNWTTLMNEITAGPANADKSSYNARNVYFFDDYMTQDDYFWDIPPYMHMLQHVYRMKDVMGSGLYIKSFHNTDLVLALHNHYPLYCVESCKNMEINPSKAKLHHYRKTCVEDVEDCDKLRENNVKDMTLWAFKNEMVDRVSALIKILEINR